MIQTCRTTVLLRLLTAIILIWFADLAQAQMPRLHAATRIIVAPVVDGDLSDACWQGTNWAERFERVMTSSGTPTGGTRARFCFDDKTLYVGIECLEPDMPALRERMSRDLAMLFSEGVEVFLDESRNMTTYHQFAVAVNGVRYQGFARDGAWKCEWKSAAKLGPTAYTVEMAIPFASLGVPVPGTNDVWGLNVCRARSVATPTELSAWSKTKDGFQNPGNFGALVFAPYAEWLSGFYAGAVGARAKAMVALCAKYPASTAGDKHIIQDAWAKYEAYRAALPRPLDTEAEACAWYERGAQLLDQVDGLDQRLRLAIITGEFR